MIKKVKARTPNVGSRATARETTRQPSNAERPRFTFHVITQPFRVRDCQREAKAAFAEWLEEVSKLTWQQIHQAPREGWGTEQIPHEQFSAALPRAVTPDRQILSMRFGRGSRVIGYREDATFHIIFVDPNHNAYAG